VDDPGSDKSDVGTEGECTSESSSGIRIGILGRDGAP
jgi:hypothetical protein